MSLPKLALQPGSISPSYFILPFFFPLAGYVLDGAKPWRLMFPLIPACLLIPFLGAACERGALDLPALFCFIAAARQVVLLALFTAVARLVKTRPLLPLLLILVHNLHLTQLGGALARGPLSASPNGVFMVALVLATGTAFCLWRFRFALTKNPEIWALPEQAENAPALSMDAFESFANTHDLTDREREILRGLIGGADLEEFAASLGVTVRTTRFHLTNLLKKTQTRNQRNLLSYYAVWKP
jgi:DNA-binding CsgD family transcriptional regulator